MARIASFSAAAAARSFVLPRRAFALQSLLTLSALASLGAAPQALAHGFQAGELRIEHPYATPSLKGQTRAALYFRQLENTGEQADELLSAHSPVAGSIELHQMQLDGHIMRMRAVPSVPLAARSALRIRHGASEGYHLMLLDLKAPLKEGDRFPVVLRFRRNGEREVMAWVQVPRDTPAPEHAHHGH